jgi:hypothetical protein
MVPCIVIIIIIIIIIITAIGLSPIGSGYFTCKQNMKLVNDKFRFKSGGLHEKHVVWQLGILGAILTFAYRHRETKKAFVEVAGDRTFPILTSSQQFGIYSKTNDTYTQQFTHIVQQIRKQYTHRTTSTTTIHT